MSKYSCVARAGALIVAAFLFVVSHHEPALAGCTSGASATCDSLGNTYPAGIVYGNANQDLTLGTGVIVNSPNNVGVWLQGVGTQKLTITSGDTVHSGGGNDGILVASSAGLTAASDVTINAQGTTVTADGLVAYGYDIFGTGTVGVNTGTVTATGEGGVAVYVRSNGGPVSVTTGGTVTAQGSSVAISPFVYSVWGVNAASTGVGSAVSVDTTGGAVSITGTNVGGGVIAASNGGELTVKTADVTVAGNWQGVGSPTSGVFASNSGATGGIIHVDTTAGSVSLTGTNSLVGFWGVYANSASGPIDVTTANVSTKGANFEAVHAESKGTGANGAVTITTTTGLIKTEGAGAIGINGLNTAAANGGLVTIHAGNVTTIGSGSAYGIQIAGPSGTATSGGATITAGTINTAGSGASGVNVRAVGAIDVAATTIVTKGDNAYGFNVTGTASADVKVTVGEVQTGVTGVSGNGAYGVNATGTGLVDIESIAGSKITTVGKGARGVNVDKLAGAVTVNVKSIETKGDNAAGIHVYNGTLSGTGTGGAITVTANSVVTTGQTVVGSSNHYEVGNTTDGIDVFNVGAGANGKISIDTSVGVTPGSLGVVSVSGKKGRGIVAVSGTLQDGGPNNDDIVVGGGAIDITTGTVTTTGDFGTAVNAETYGSGVNGAITINALGAVSASGLNLFNLVPPENEGNYQPNGIRAFSWGGGDVMITTKDVSSVGASAPAIGAQSGNGDLNAGIGKVTINTTGGTVSSKGGAAAGIQVGSSSGEVKITTANVTTEGDGSNGIQANNRGVSSAMTIDTTLGKITTTGKNSTGISASTGNGALTTKNAGLLKITAGNVETTGQGAVGIGANANDGSIEIEAKGAVTTGATGGDGIQVGADGTTTAKVTVTGSIVTQATTADGLQILGTGGVANSATVIVNGEIKASGSSAAGILVGTASPNITVNANGKVTGGKVGILLQERSAASVTNSGQITGTAGTAVEFAGGLVSTFDNDGTVTGNVLLAGGADSAILRSNSAITGNVNGGSGTDKLTLTGAGTASTLNTATILEFENAEKTGTGKWALTGTNADFAPTFAVNGGLLAANAILAGTDFAVANGATLGGNGTLKSITVASGGTLAPGNSIDTLTVGTATYQAGAIYEVEIDPNTSDLLNVSGTATIASTAEVHVIVTPGGTYTDGKRYKILDAVTRTGEFTPTVVETSAFLDFTLDQSIPGEVWLVAALTAELPDVAETPNQIAAAGGIDEQGPGTPLFDAIVPLDADSARQAFDLTSGEIHATEQGVLLEDSRFVREAILQRLDEAFAVGVDGGGADPSGPVIATWAQAFGSGGSGQGDGNAAGYGRAIGGFVAGIDLGEPGAWRFGVAAGYQAARLSVPDRLSTATADGYHFAGYGALEQGPFALRFGGALANGTLDTVRNATFAGFDETLTAHYGVRTGQVFAEASYRATVGNMAFEPFAGVARVVVDTDGFTESGGVAALSGGPEHLAMTVASFGARFEAPLPMAGARITALLAWQHRFEDVTPTASLAFDGGTPFTVAGVPRKRDSLRVEAGFEWDISPRATLSVGYAGNIASGASDHGAKATLKFRF